MKLKNKKRGSVSTEYIIILCFIGAIASSFMSVDLTGALNDAVAKVHRALGIEKGNKYHANVAPDAEKYKDAIEAAVDYVMNSSIFKNEDGLQLAHVTFFKGGIDGVWYYDPSPGITNGVRKIDLTSEQKAILKSELTNKMSETDYQFGNNALGKSGSLFFDQQGNVVWNDPYNRIGGQGRDTCFSFNEGKNSIYVKYGSEGTWSFSTEVPKM